MQAASTSSREQVVVADAHVGQAGGAGGSLSGVGMTHGGAGQIGYVELGNIVINKT